MQIHFSLLVVVSFVKENSKAITKNVGIVKIKNQGLVEPIADSAKPHLRVNFTRFKFNNLNILLKLIK